MANEMERLIVSLEARTKAFDNQMKKSADATQRQLNRIEKQFADANKKLVLKPPVIQGAGMGGVFGSVRGLAGPLAAAASLKGAQELLDTSTRIRNSLRVAGLEGEALTDVYKQLFASAQRNAVPIESLVSLYGKLALTQKELGASSADLIKFSDNVAVALRAGGTDAQAASGALLQLSQALGGGIVRAEEFNSVLEGAPTIAQAVAAGLTEAGGSVAKLRQLVVDGEVSSQAFFRAFEAGAAMLRDKVAGAEMTVSQAFVRLQNVLVDVATKFDGTTGASAKLAKFLSEDLAKAIEETGTLLTKFGGGASDFVGWVNKVTDAIVGLAAEAGQLSGLDQIGAALGATPYRSETLARTPEQIRGRIGELEQQLGGLANAAKPFKDALQQQIDKLKEELLLIEQIGESQRLLTTSRAFGGAPGGGGAAVAVRPISLADYPITGAAAAGEKAGKAFQQGLQKFLAAGKDPSHVIDLDDVFSERLLAFVSAAPGGGISINSGFRSFERQAELWEEALKKYGSAEAARKWVAPPGASQHNKGGAADLGFANDAARQWAHDNAQYYGLNFRMGHEPWHIESASGGGASGRERKSPEQLFGGSVEDVEKRIALINAEMEATRGLATGVDDYGYAVEKARVKQDLLNDAKAAGLTITPELAASIDTLAGNYARASANAEQLAASQQLSTEAAADFADTAKDVLGGFINDLRDGKSASEALANALSRVGDRLLDVGLDALFGGGKGGGLGFIGSLFGFGGGGAGGMTGLFADGGIAARGKRRPLPRFAGGGISRSAAIFGEAGPEAAVPLPDGRRIPVDLRIPPISTPAIPQRASMAQEITLRVIGEEGPMFRPTIQAESQGVAVRVVRQGITSYDKEAKRAFPQRMAQAQIRDF